MGISVIVPAYNNTNFIKECVESIYESGIDREYELLIGVDACEETFEYLKTLTLNENTKVFLFLKNGGPYIIKNTLAKIAKYDKLIFFDSDDVMKNVMIPVCEDGLDKFLVVRPRMTNFRDINGNRKYDQKKKWGEGVFAIKQELFLTLNGFEGWRVAADSDFLARLVRNRAKIWSTQDVLFDRRVHPNSLTMSRETGFSSLLRMEYAKKSKQKTYFGPLAKLTVGDYVEFIVDKQKVLNLKDLLSEDEEKIRLEEYKKKKKLISQILSGENIQPRITNSSKPNYDEINKTQVLRNNFKTTTQNAHDRIKEMSKGKKNFGGRIVR